MPLFDDLTRSDTRPKMQNEASFDYLNISARPGVCAERDLLEGWFEHLPTSAKADVRGRFRSSDEIQNQSAFFELFCHELLLRSGYEVETHPAVPNERTVPDFLAILGGSRQFYLEATLAAPAHEVAMADRRFAELHDTLNRMNSPDYFLTMECRGDPQGNMRGRNLRDRLEVWLSSLNFEEIAQQSRAGNYEAIPTLDWVDAGCTVTFRPSPKGPSFRGKPGVRPIGIVAPELRLLRTHEDIRSAIEGKSKKYGPLDIPLVVAVNVTSDFCDDEDIWNGLFGDYYDLDIPQPDGGWISEPRRVPNGAWRGRVGARGKLVSAILIVNQLLPSTLRAHPVRLIHNPWADNPLTPSALKVPQCTIDIGSGQINHQNGISAADILGIQDPWPIQDR